MSKREEKSLSAEAKFKIVCDHFLRGIAVSELCEKHGISPSLFYTWQKTLIEHGPQVFDRKGSKRNENLKVKKMSDELEHLKAQISSKNDTLAELMREYVQLKKSAIGES